MKIASSMKSFSSIHIAGISTRFTKSDLLEYFREFGRLDSLNLFLDKATGQNTGFAILIAPQNTISQILGASSHYLKGSVLSIAPMPRQTRQQPPASKIVEKQSPEKKQRKEPAAAVVITNIDKRTTKEEAKDFFSNFGSLRSLNLKPISQKKQKVFVEYQNQEAASKLVSEVQRNNEILMNGSKVTKENVQIINKNNNLEDSQATCTSPQEPTITGQKAQNLSDSNKSGRDLSSADPREVHITLREQSSVKLGHESAEEITSLSELSKVEKEVLSLD